MDGVVYYKNFHGGLCKLKAEGLDSPEQVTQAVEDTEEYLTGLGYTPHAILISIAGGKA